GEHGGGDGGGGGEPQRGCVVVGAQCHRITAHQKDIHRNAFDDQQHQHRTQRHPPRRPCQYDADRQQCSDRGQWCRDIESQYPPGVPHRIDSSREIISLPSTSEIPRPKFQCTVCGLPPAFSLTEVATTMTVSVRRAIEAGNCSAGAGRPGWASRSWCTVSNATASTSPRLRDCNRSTTCW